MKVIAILFTVNIPLLCIAQKMDSTLNKQTDSTITSKIFALGEVNISSSKSGEIINRVNVANFESQYKIEVSTALNMLPGISLTAVGPRNEAAVSVRGFDLRQVPVYIDGIPVYVPYDGYVDLARFTTTDLAAIDVSKGFSSIVYGPNSLGGAINLVSRKPVKILEYDGAIGFINANGYKGNINVGSNFGKFYVQGGISYLHRDSYTLPGNFTPTKTENGGERDNAYRTDQKISLKAGWVPNNKSEYSVEYINQQGQKGTPVYCGSDTLNSLYKSPRYWKWPAWNKESYYFISNTNIGNKSYVKTRIYYDKFVNTLFSYDDASYTTQKKGYSFQSYYNDYTYGGSVELGTKIIANNDLKLAIHYKEDVHRENNLNEPVRHFEDNTISVGVEDVYKLTSKLVLIPGVSYDVRRNIVAEDYNNKTMAITDFVTADAIPALNGQLGIFYFLSDNEKLGLSFAHKTRFATIKDRYSYKMGTAIPNPDLNPESANNYEINYSAKFSSKLSLQSALFYSNITDVILSVNNVLPGKAQMQNFGKAEYEGVEAQLNYSLLTNLSVSANYTYIDRKNISNPTIHFTDVPNNKIYAFLQYQPIKRLNVILSTEYNSSRYSTSYGTKTAGFTLVNAVVSYKILKNFNVDAGINNIFDINYSLVEGFPEEGRNYFVTLRFFNF